MQNNFLKRHQKHLKKFAFYLFIVVYFITLLYLCNRQYIWEDEAYSLNTTSHNLFEVVKFSYNFEGQPPFYFLLLAVWRKINSSIFFARLLSVILIAISAYYFKRLISFLNGEENTNWLLIIFLLNPFTIWAALEIRLYALVILLSILLLYYFYPFYNNQKNKNIPIFLSLSLFGIYTQYFFAFFIAALAISLWMFKGKKMFFTFCLYLLPVIIFSLPNLYFISTQLSIAHDYISSYSIHTTLLDILRTPQNFILGLNAVTLGKVSRWVIKIIFLIVLLLAVPKFIRCERVFKYANKNFIYFCFGVIIILCSFYLVAVPFLHVIYQEKYLIIGFPIFLLLFSVFNVTQTIRNFVFVSISFYFTYLFALEYREPVKSFDFKKVSVFITKIEQKDEPILFYGKSILPPFHYYYNGQNKLYGIPFIKYDKNYYKKIIKDTSEFINSIKKIQTASNSYLLITGSLGGVVHHSPMTKQMIDKCLANHFIVESDSSFESVGSKNALRVRRIIQKKELNR